jgi:dienelactone hydrolase
MIECCAGSTVPRCRRFATLAVIALLTLAGCSSNPSIHRERAQTDILQSAARAGFLRGEVATSLGRLSYWRRGPANASHINIYIEGDGRAWRTRSQPSDDPTPRNPVALKLALQDNAAAVIYIARPCQFSTARSEAVCEQRYWTSHRYAEAVVQAFDDALSAFAARSGGQPSFGLTGFSGGGVIAALVAARRTDIEWLVSVAANLDTSAWTDHHGVEALRESLNPADQAAKLRHLPQVHLSGARDRVAPQFLLQNFIDRLAGARVQQRIYADFDHGCCWAQIWPQDGCRLLRDADVGHPALCLSP